MVLLPARLPTDEQIDAEYREKIRRAKNLAAHRRAKMGRRKRRSGSMIYEYVDSALPSNTNHGAGYEFMG